MNTVFYIILTMSGAPTDTGYISSAQGYVSTVEKCVEVAGRMEIALPENFSAICYESAEGSVPVAYFTPFGFE